MLKFSCMVVSLLVVQATCQFPPPISVAHRGASGEFPENTLEAFAEGTRQGALVNELDLMLTADNRVVIMHDQTVDRTTSGTGTVRSKTVAELKALDAGSWKGPQFANVRIPTIEEVLEQFLALDDYQQRGLLLDIKYDSDPILRYLNGLNLSDELLARLMMGTWTLRETQLTTKLWGNRTQNCVINSEIPLDVERRPDVTILNLNKNGILDASWVSRMRGLGKVVFGWTSATVQETIDDTARASRDGWNGVVNNWPEYVRAKRHH